MRLIVLFCLLVAFVAAGVYAGAGRIEWCPQAYSEDCKPMDYAITPPAVAADPTQTTPPVVEEEEEEVLQEFIQTLDASESNSTAPLNTTTSTSTFNYDCKTDCRKILGSLNCARCNYPYAFYNKSFSSYNKCLLVKKDLRSLKKEDRDCVKTLCVKDGGCTCASFERFEAFMDASCRINCKHYVKKLDKNRMIFLNYGLDISNKKQFCMAKRKEIKTNKVLRNQVVEYCEKNRYSMNWLLRTFNVTKAISLKLSLKADELLNEKKMVKPALFRALGFPPLKTVQQNQQVQFFLDTTNANLFRRNWLVDITLEGSAFSIQYIKKFKSTNTTTFDNIKNENVSAVLDEANKQGFNHNNKKANPFLPEVIIGNNRVIVQYVYKQDAAGSDSRIKDLIETFRQTVNSSKRLPKDWNEKSSFLARYASINAPKMLAVGKTFKKYVRKLKMRNMRYKYSWVLPKFAGTKATIYVRREFTRKGPRLYVELKEYRIRAALEAIAQLKKLLKPEWIATTLNEEVVEPEKSEEEIKAEAHVKRLKEALVQAKKLAKTARDKAKQLQKLASKKHAKNGQKKRAQMAQKEYEKAAKKANKIAYKVKEAEKLVAQLAAARLNKKPVK